MFRFLCFITTFLSLVTITNLPACAVEARGVVGAIILSPLKMELSDAKRLCAEEIQLVQCEVIKDEQAEQENKELKTAGLIDDYVVYTANFE